MNSADELTLDLPNFTGPLDLLLYLIRSQKVDIYDIPIAKITGQYLTNLARWQTLDLQVAGEYFVMASTLPRIEPQYLLSKNDFVEEDQYQEGPRAELVEQLVQYLVFQRTAEYFKKRDEEMSITVTKDLSVSSKKKVEPLPLGETTNDELANIFKVVLERSKLRKPQVGQIEVYETLIEEMTTFLKDKLHHRKKASFFDCIKNFQDLDRVIGLFLAVLELCHDHKILIKQNRDFGDLELERVETSDK